MSTTGMDDYRGREIDGRDETIKVVGGTTHVSNSLDIWLVTCLKRKYLYGVLMYRNRESCGKNQQVLINRLRGTKVMVPSRGSLGRKSENSDDI